MRFLVFFLCFISLSSSAQDSTSQISFSGYSEMYFCYDFGKPESIQRQPFLYNHNRHALPQANLLLLKMQFRKSSYRTVLGLMSGTYADDNLAAEPSYLRSFYEASAGFRINRHKEIWIDAGVFASHIGFESAAGKDCATLSRSLMAENSPYFESGIRLSTDPKNEKRTFALLILNGWQRIRLRNKNLVPSIGHQLTLTPNSKVKINSSSFIGNDKDWENRQWRFYHNAWIQFNLKKKWNFTTAFDIGAEQSGRGSKTFHVWQAGVFQLQYLLSDKWKSALRAEYFSDPGKTIISSVPGNQFSVVGGSFNLDFQPQTFLIWRNEFRVLQSSNAVFAEGTGFSRQNISAVTALLFSF